MKKTFPTVSLLVQGLFALMLSLFVAYGRQGFVAGVAAPERNQLLWCLSDGCFVTGLLFTGFGGMLLITTTGFFDIFSYAVRNLLMLFTPLRNPKDTKHYIDYKAERAQRRRRATPETLLVGVFFLLTAFVLMLFI